MVHRRLLLQAFAFVTALALVMPMVWGDERARVQALKKDLKQVAGGDRVPVLLQLSELEKGDSTAVFKYTDEILAILEDAPDAIAEARARVLRAWAYQDSAKYNSALNEANRAKEIADQAGDERGLAKAYYAVAVVHWRQSDLDDALELAHSAISINRGLGDQGELASSLALLGAIYRSKGDFQNSIKSHLESRDIAEELQDESAIARSNNNLGLIYWGTSRHEEAYEAFKLALNVYQQDSTDTRIDTCLSNMGLVLIEMGEPKKALVHLQEALNRHESYDKPFARAKVISNIGYAYEEMGEEDKAIEFYEKALSIRREIGDKRGIVRSVGVIATSYQHKEKHQKAIELLTEAFDLAKEIDARSEQAEVLNRLSESQAALGLNAEALESFRDYHDLQMELTGPDVKQRIADLEQRYKSVSRARELERLQASEDELKSKLADQRTIIIASLFLWFGLLGICFLYLSRVRALQAMRVSNDELQQKTEMLRESENRYRMLFESADVPTFLIDEKSARVVNWNPEAIKHGASDVRQHPIPLEKLEPSWIREGAQRYLAANQNGEVAKDYFRFENSGSVRWTEVRGCRVHVDGKSAQLISVRDTTERKALEKARIRADRLESLGVLAGGIAHDFNNVLMAILGYISLTKKRIGGEEFNELSLAEEAATQASRLTDQLLAFAKGGEPVRTVHRITPLLHQAVQLASAGSGMRIDIDVESELWNAELDAGQFGQVISNLVINADQATSSSGMLMVSAKNFVGNPQTGESGGDGRKFVQIDFADNGIGIPAEIQEQVFDPYFTTKNNGSGLGLATAFTIVKRHGGFLNFHSHEGQGALFSVFLPAATSCASPTIVTTNLSEDLVGADCEESLLKGAQILVLEDEPLLQQMYELLLSRWGCHVEVVSDGATVVELYRDRLKSSNPFDLMIMDLTVPGGVGGQEAISQILAIDPGAQAIVASGYANSSAMAKFNDLGFKGSLSKPFRDYELNSLVREVLRSRAKPSQHFTL